MHQEGVIENAINLITKSGISGRSQDNLLRMDDELANSFLPAFVDDRPKFYLYSVEIEN